MTTDQPIDIMLPADSVEAVSTAAPPRPRRRRWPYVTLFVLTVLVATSFLIPLPYVLFAPGFARSTEDRIEITDGPEVPDANDGDILFLTVTEQRATVAGAVRAWLDPIIDSAPEDEVLPPGGRKEDRILNRLRMDESKFVASSLALKAVGYPVVETGTGAFIDRLLPGYPAGEQLRQGEVITSIDGEPIRTRSELGESLVGRPVGDSVVVGVRDPAGAQRTVTVELGLNPDDDSRGYLGVVPTTADRDLDLPFGVTIDNGRVTGPSAGLAFTLGIIDRLTPGSLTGPKPVAVTGTVAPDGTVGPIGGIVQKSVAVDRSGATRFLYPAATGRDELRRVRAVLGDRVELIPVATLDEAIAVLAPEGLPAAPPLQP